MSNPSYDQLVSELATLTDKNRVLEARIDMADKRFKSAVDSKNGEINDLRAALTAASAGLIKAQREAAYQRVLAHANSATPQFTEEELRTLVGLVHPDKHEGKESAVRMTQKINQLRSKR